MQVYENTKKNEPFNGEKIAQLAVSIATEKKAFSPVILDIKSLGGCSDYFVIVSANNPRQVSAVAESIRSLFKKHLSLKPIQIDGLETSSWVLLDYGFLFIHIFLEETRTKYGLEELWAKGLHVPLEEDDSHLVLQSLVNQSLAENLVSAND